MEPKTRNFGGLPAVASEHVAPHSPCLREALKPAGCAGDGQRGGDGHRAECEVAGGPSRGSGRTPGMFSQVSLCLKGNRLRGKGRMTFGMWLQHFEGSLNQPKGDGSTSQKAGTEFERQEHPHFFRKKWYG